MKKAKPEDIPKSVKAEVKAVMDYLNRCLADVEKRFKRITK